MLFMNIFISILLLAAWTRSIGTVDAVSLRAKNSKNQSRLTDQAKHSPDVRRTLDWIDCETFFGHLDTLALAAGTKRFTSQKWYTPYVCTKVFGHFKSNPVSVDAVVNLAYHIEKIAYERRKLRHRDPVEDVASQLRGSYAAQKLTIALYKDTTPSDFDRRLQVWEEDFFPFGGDDPAKQITDCDAAAGDDCPHNACVPNYLWTQKCTLCERGLFWEFPPAYGGGVLYAIGTSIINDKYLDMIMPGSAVLTELINTVTKGNLNLDEGIWSGKKEDRTSTNNVGYLLVISAAQSIAEILAEGYSSTIPDDMEIPAVCVDLPNPLKIVAEWGPELVIKLIGFVLDQLTKAAAFQDGLVDGAEVEAAYEHTRNLLEKSCAIYDAAVCRCQDDANPAGVYGKGCDGLDSDCDDVIDECDEDTVLPTIDVENVYMSCAASTGKWFLSATEAQQCVENTVEVSDDCQATTEKFSTVDSCGTSTVTVSTVDACNTATPVTAVIPVQIDGGKPTAQCSFTAGATLITTGPSILVDPGFTYDAYDNCGGPLNVTVTMYSSEIEDFNAQKLALLYRDTSLVNNKARLYLARGICSTSSNGQCIKDPKAPDSRKYTAVVSATDEAGNYNEAECSIDIIPQGGKPPSSPSISTQRFYLTAYSSIFPTSVAPA